MDIDRLKAAARGTAAKTDRQDAQLYLPVWMHALDTAGIMERLYHKWLAGAVIGRLAAEIGEDMLYPVCRLLALTHDIGKLTAQFQTNIQTQLDEYALCVFRVPHDRTFYQGHTVPHARARRYCSGTAFRSRSRRSSARITASRRTAARRSRWKKANGASAARRRTHGNAAGGNIWTRRSGCAAFPRRRSCRCCPCPRRWS